MNDELTEVVVNRVLEKLDDMKADDKWIDEIIDIAGEGTRRDVKKILSRLEAAVIDI